ncbi:ARM repeat-containing protein, partial [Metschnikowia bicuspidata]
MDKNGLLRALSNTLDADKNVRRLSEDQLAAYEHTPGFTAYLLELITDPEVSFGVQASAAIFFKNRVANYWVVPDLKAVSPKYVHDNEKAQIKTKLVETLSHTYKNTQLRAQLGAAISSILDAEKWEELVPVMEHLLGDTGSVDHVFTGLLCLLQYTKSYRFAGIDTEKSSNIVLNEIVEKTFPALERLAGDLLRVDSSQSDEMLYLILKIFRYSTMANLPSYLENLGNLGKWCHTLLFLMDRPLLDYVLSVDAEERALLPRVKAVKWCFGNMLTLLWRHGGGVGTKNKKSAFATRFVADFVPQILNTYWTIIEKWATHQTWLSQASLYNLISFMEQVVETSAFALLRDKIEAIVGHVLLPMLSASEQTIQLYKDDPEEYVRRFFDVSKENATADTAAINFLYRLSTLKFSACGAIILNIANEVFQRHAANRDDLETACETEGALRIIATVSYQLNKKTSPVKGRIDELLHTVVFPELSAATIAKTPWLTARACDTIAIFMHKFSDQDVLRDVFHGVVACFQQQEHFPIRLTAVDALRALGEEPYVAGQIAQQAPQLMGTLLDMSKSFESDILTSVMDVFVSKFAANLEPYASELSYRLVEQFLALAHQVLEHT